MQLNRITARSSSLPFMCATFSGVLALAIDTRVSIALYKNEYDQEMTQTF